MIIIINPRLHSLQSDIGGSDIVAILFIGHIGLSAQCTPMYCAIVVMLKLRRLVKCLKCRR
jgi:hypothetical protein